MCNDIKGDMAPSVKDAIVSMLPRHEKEAFIKIFGSCCCSRLLDFPALYSPRELWTTWWCVFLLSGLSGEYLEGGAPHGLHGRPTCLGENAGEDEVGGGQVFDRAQEGGRLGQRCGPADQSDQDESVCARFLVPVSAHRHSVFSLFFFPLNQSVIFWHAVRIQATILICILLINHMCASWSIHPTCVKLLIFCIGLKGNVSALNMLYLQKDLAVYSCTSVSLGGFIQNVCAAQVKMFRQVIWGAPGWQEVWTAGRSFLPFAASVGEGSEQCKTFLMKELTGCAADILICQRWEQATAAAHGPVHYIRNVTVNKPAQQVDLPEVERCDH